MINVDKRKGVCTLCGTGLEIAEEVAAIAASFCEAVVEQREPGTSEREAMKHAAMRLRVALRAGIAAARPGEGSVPGEEDSGNAE